MSIIFPSKIWAKSVHSWQIQGGSMDSRLSEFIAQIVGALKPPVTITLSCVIYLLHPLGSWEKYPLKKCYFPLGILPGIFFLRTFRYSSLQNQCNAAGSMLCYCIPYFTENSYQPHEEVLCAIGLTRTKCFCFLFKK